MVQPTIFCEPNFLTFSVISITNCTASSYDKHNIYDIKMSIDDFATNFPKILRSTMKIPKGDSIITYVSFWKESKIQNWEIKSIERILTSQSFELTDFSNLNIETKKYPENRVDRFEPQRVVDLFVDRQRAPAEKASRSQIVDRGVGNWLRCSLTSLPGMFRNVSTGQRTTKRNASYCPLAWNWEDVAGWKRHQK